MPVDTSRFAEETTFAAETKFAESWGLMVFGASVPSAPSLCVLAKVLKMNQDQWTRAFEHAMRAVDVDNTARLWLPPPTAGAPHVGLVFSCKRGKVDMQRPLGAIVMIPTSTRLPTACCPM